jgi:hypothetical protein
MDNPQPPNEKRSSETPEDIAALRKAKAEASATLLKHPLVEAVSARAQRAAPPVIGVGIGPKVVRKRERAELAIRFYVVRKIPKDRLAPDALLPREVGGFATDVEGVGRIVAYNDNQRASRPVKGGVSISLSEPSVGFRYAGTLGCWAHEAKDPGTILGLSNNHVLADENRARAGDEVVQPGTLDDSSAGVVGRFVRCKPVDFGGGANHVDAAVFAPSEPSMVDLDILGVGTPTGSAAAARRLTVVKSGRTTGVTRGTVRDIDADIQVQYDQGVALFEGQVAVSGKGGSKFSKAGDSGSAILDDGSKKVVALLFAGSDRVDRTFANPIASVLEQLEITI